MFLQVEVGGFLLEVSQPLRISQASA